MKTSEAKKKLGVECCAYACKNKPIARKGGLCHKHFSRKRKETDKVYDRFVNFRGNALRRGKQFSITLVQFRFFCHNTGYILTKGMRGRNSTVDRIDNRHGYHLWNIQLLTNWQNIRKYFDHDRHLDECPF